RDRLDDLVLLDADAPSVGRALDASAECLCEQLVAEADADERTFALDRLEQQLFDAGDPRLVVVHRVSTRRAEPAVALVERARELTAFGGIRNDLDVDRSEQRREELRVVAGDVPALLVDVADDQQPGSSRHRKEKTGPLTRSRAGRSPRARRIGITPSPNQYASSRCG